MKKEGSELTNYHAEKSYQITMNNIGGVYILESSKYLVQKKLDMLIGQMLG